MKRRRWTTVAILALLAVVLLAWPKLSRLYATVNLFEADRIVDNFSSMRELFFHQDIQRRSSTQAWPQAASTLDLPSSFAFRGESIATEMFLEQTRTTSLLVVQDGEIAHERYFLGTDRNDLRISFSIAKSYLSAMFGIAVGEGLIKSLDDSVDAYVPELANSAYRGVSIRDVLNMASGVAFNEDYLAFDSDINKMGRVLALGGSMDKFAASLTERNRSAGEKRQYVSIDTHVLAMVLRAATGRSLADYFAETLWNPLGPERDAYYLTDGHGVAFALGGLNMTTRDYARFGELFRRQGRWGDQQLVPRDWVAKSTANNAPTSASGSPLGYGYQWWVPPESNDEFFAVGIYGQYIYVSPSTKTVIVKTSAHRGFQDDGQAGVQIKLATIELFRAIAQRTPGSL